MIINGKWMNEPEIIALISQLTADKKRLERQLIERGKWLKVAVEDFRILGTQFEDEYSHCTSKATCDDCPLGGGNLCDECHWRFEKNILKLIEKDGENNA